MKIDIVPALIALVVCSCGCWGWHALGRWERRQRPRVAGIIGPGISHPARTITASLEGQRITVCDAVADFQEYHFDVDKWVTVETLTIPVGACEADLLVTEWNPVDRREAVLYLTGKRVA